MTTMERIRRLTQDLIYNCFRVEANIETETEIDDLLDQIKTILAESLPSERTTVSMSMERGKIFMEGYNTCLREIKERWGLYDGR